MNITEDYTRACYYFGFCVFTIFYFLMPFDLVPDYLNYIGYFDDLILIFAFIFAITSCFYQDFKDKNDREYKLIRSN